MKALETVFRAISKQYDQCESCNAREGMERTIKGLSVKLESVPNGPDYKKYCQICYIQQLEKPQPEKNKDMLQLIKKFSLAVLFVGIFSFIFTITLAAQPGLPGPPDQAPIDGGLGLLAAAGGAYAWKKLKDKNNMNEE